MQALDEKIIDSYKNNLFLKIVVIIISPWGGAKIWQSLLRVRLVIPNKNALNSTISYNLNTTYVRQILYIIVIDTHTYVFFPNDVLPN